MPRALSPAAELRTNESNSRFLNRTQFTADGTFVVPAGITKVWVSLWGGGGGGSFSGTSWNNGGGGATGIIRALLTVTPTESIAVTIGAAGANGGLNAGSTGGTSSFGALLSALGGDGARNTAGPTQTATLAATYAEGVLGVGNKGQEMGASSVAMSGGMGAWGSYYGRGGNSSGGGGAVAGICVVEW